MNTTPESRKALTADAAPKAPTEDAALPPSEDRLPQSVPTPRRLFAIAVFAAIVGFGITLSFGYADHDPKPHGVRIAIAAPPAVSAKVAAGLEHAEPGGFHVVPVPSAGAAIHSVRSQSTAGALVVPPSGPATIVTAGAEGVLQQQALTAALTAASRSMHRVAKSLDVARLPSGDRAGLSSFVFGLGLLIPSVLGGLGLFLLGSRLRLWWRVAAATLFALLVACGGVLAMDTILGALTGASGALIGIGFLGALSFVLFVAALQAVVGLPGTALAAVAFIFVGNAISGGSVPVGFLPGGFRQIAPWLPNNAIISGVRDVVYFNGHNLGHPLLVLVLWPVLALSIIAAVDLLHLSERRRRPHQANEIYGTPAVVHVSRRLGTQSAEGSPNRR
ncbi:MAG: ABC transporter permease [Solirubrobacteraceae bacterium]